MTKREKFVEALFRVHDVLTILECEGFKVSIHSCSDSEVEENANELPKELWTTVSIVCNEDWHEDFLWEIEDQIHNEHISFDSGMGFGARDWELDFSFEILDK